MVSEMETKALKEIANHYGIRQVLENTTMLYNAIGDMLGEDGNKLRNQMRLAMDAGVGNLYLQQIQVPAVGFEHRVMTVLQEDCGMSSDSASNLKRLLDEMTGMIPAASCTGVNQHACTNDVEREKANSQTAFSQHSASTATDPQLADGVSGAKMPRRASLVTNAESMRTTTFQAGKAWKVALLPFGLTILYSLIDKVALGWLHYIFSGIQLFSSGLSVQSLFQRHYGYRFFVPLILFAILPLMGILLTQIILKKKYGNQEAKPYCISNIIGGVGTLAAGYLAAWTFALTTQVPGTMIQNMMRGVWVILFFDLTTALWILQYAIYLGGSLLAGAIGVFVGKKDWYRQHGSE